MENYNSDTAMAVFFVAIAVVMMIAAALVVIPAGLALQEVTAQGPPAKAQLILSTPPSERGTVASGGQAGGGGHGGCGDQFCE